MAADLAALVICLTRPPRIYEALGLGGSDAVPFQMCRAWARGWLAPWTPLGFLSIFDAADLVFILALTFILLALLALLASIWLPALASPRKVPWPPPFHLSVRAALVAVALLGIELGCEIDGWKTWRLRVQWVQRLHNATELGDRSRQEIATLRDQVRWLESPADHEPLPGEDLTREALAAARAASRDRLKARLDDLERWVKFYDRLRIKYHWAVAHPRASIALDPPVPQREPDAEEWYGRKDYRRALDAFDEQIRRYPNLWIAHYHRARILATCPEARLRDGQAAVASATRACELTRWKHGLVLETLAAAHAEAGDFAAAVAWQKRAMACVSPVRLGSGQPQKRLDLYQQGRPYHE
jgi:tetratricopeptide (TPR) repeat protein